MSLPITRLLFVAIGCYGLIILVDLLLKRRLIRCFFEGIILIAVVIVLHLTTGFPIVRQAFGGVSLIPAVGIMLGCTALGMAARYVFYRENFTWGSFLRPLVIAPIILLPLIGTMQGIAEFQSFQLLSFGILSFQNGFFWQEVFRKIRKDVGVQGEARTN